LSSTALLLREGYNFAMRIDAVWRDEKGKDLGVVLDPKTLLSRFVLRSAPWPEGLCCPRFLDPYGDACFKQFQILTLIQELRGVRFDVYDQDLARHLDEVVALAEKASETHTYFWFFGDWAKRRPAPDADYARAGWKACNERREC